MFLLITSQPTFAFSQLLLGGLEPCQISMMKITPNILETQNKHIFSLYSKVTKYEVDEIYFTKTKDIVFEITREKKSTFPFVVKCC